MTNQTDVEKAPADEKAKAEEKAKADEKTKAAAKPSRSSSPASRAEKALPASADNLSFRRNLQAVEKVRDHCQAIVDTLTPMTRKDGDTVAFERECATYLEHLKRKAKQMAELDGADGR